MKRSYIVLLLASVSLMATACGGGSSLKENDPDSYDFYQELEDNWDADNWTPENGFLGGY